VCGTLQRHKSFACCFGVAFVPRFFSAFMKRKSKRRAKQQASEKEGAPCVLVFRFLSSFFCVVFLM
jgi:hypothetical protein